MDTQSIIQEIQSKLTGQKEHDLEVLQSYSKQYSQDPEAVPVIQAIGKIYLEQYTDHSAEEIEAFSAVPLNELNQEIQDIATLASNGNVQEALQRLTPLIQSTDEALREQQGKAFYSFETPIEEILFVNLCPNDGFALRMPLLYDKLYYMYGSLLFEAQEFERSQAALREAVRLNPVKVAAYFELGEIAKVQNKLDELDQITRRAWEFSFLRPQLARCYRNFAHIALKQNKTRLAAALLRLAQNYHQTETAERMRQSLHKMDPKAQAAARRVKLKTLLEPESIPLGPNLKIYETLLHLGAQTRASDPELALSAFEIAYDLTQYKPLLEEISALKNHIQSHKTA